MSRSVLLTLALAGCDLVFPTTPANPQHDLDASTGTDGIPHPPGDASCELPVGQDELLTEGSWFTADRASGRAVKLETGIVREVVGDVDTHLESDYHVILEPKPNGVDAYDAPRLAPGGDELFLSLVDPVGNLVLGRTTRGPNGWDAPAKVPVLDLTGSEILDLGIGIPSPPTTTSPRRMAMTFGTTVGELEERGGAWQIIHQYNPQAELGDNRADDAMITPDGLHLMFGTGSAVRMSERTDPSQQFVGSIPLFMGEVGFRSGVFFTEDCQRHLYYTKVFNIHHVVLP